MIYKEIVSLRNKWDWSEKFSCTSINSLLIFTYFWTKIRWSKSLPELAQLCVLLPENAQHQIEDVLHIFPSFLALENDWLTDKPTEYISRSEFSMTKFFLNEIVKKKWVKVKKFGRLKGKLHDRETRFGQRDLARGKRKEKSKTNFFLFQKCNLSFFKENKMNWKSEEKMRQNYVKVKNEWKRICSA